MKYLVTVISAIIISNTAFALELKKEIAKCAAVEGEMARLDCYDKLANATGVSKKKSTNQKKAGNWTLEINKNPIDDSKIVMGILAAQSGSSKWGIHIDLLLRCKSKKTDAFIDWGSYLGEDDRDVLIRLGDAEAVTDRWQSSADKTATFYRGDVVDFIKKLESSKKFVAQITPYKESPITAVFDLNGIEKVTKALKETCEWDKPNKTAPATVHNK